MSKLEDDAKQAYLKVHRQVLGSSSQGYVLEANKLHEAKPKILCGSFRVSEYVNSQRPKTISAVIHHTIFASRIHFQQGGKKNGLSIEVKDNGQSKRKASLKANASKTPTAKEKGFKGKARLSQEGMEWYKNKKNCFNCGQEGHVSRVCPKRNERNDNPRVIAVQTLKEDDHSKGSPLLYARIKIRYHDDLI